MSKLDELSQQEIDLAMNELVGSCENILTKYGIYVGTGKEASDLVHEFWFKIVDRSIEERNKGHELY